MWFCYVTFFFTDVLTIEVLGNNLNEVLGNIGPEFVEVLVGLIECFFTLKPRTKEIVLPWMHVFVVFKVIYAVSFRFSLLKCNTRLAILFDRENSFSYYVLKIF